MIEDNASITNIVYVYIFEESERANILEMVKAKHPGMDIELIKNGFRIREIHKKTQAEKDEYFKTHKPIARPAANSDWQEEATRLSKGKRK